MTTQKAEQSSGANGARKPRLTPEERQQRRLEEYNLAANLFKMRKVEWPVPTDDVKAWVAAAYQTKGTVIEKIKQQPAVGGIRG